VDRSVSEREEIPESLYPPAPPRARALLRKAAGAWLDTGRAREYLLEADRLYGDDLAVVVGCYKFHFYKGLLREALPYAQRAARIMGARLGLPENLPEVGPDDADFSGYEAGPRFYLFALKAAGYLHARLGEIPEALSVLETVRRLDRADRLEVSRLIALIVRGGGEDE
jgi:hypothetical protein